MELRFEFFRNPHDGRWVSRQRMGDHRQVKSDGVGNYNRLDSEAIQFFCVLVFDDEEVACRGGCSFEHSVDVQPTPTMFRPIQQVRMFGPASRQIIPWSQ